jgi:hypothetical protein
MRVREREREREREKGERQSGREGLRVRESGRKWEGG